MTKSRKIILCPLEELKVQPRGTLTINEVPLENTLDLQFKPGLYLQIQAFLNQEYGNLVSVDEQVDMCQIYKKIELGQC